MHSGRGAHGFFKDGSWANRESPIFGVPAGQDGTENTFQPVDNETARRLEGVPLPSGPARHKKSAISGRPKNHESKPTCTPAQVHPRRAAKSRVGGGSRPDPPVVVHMNAANGFCENVSFRQALPGRVESIDRRTSRILRFKGCHRNPQRTNKSKQISPHPS